MQITRDNYSQYAQMVQQMFGKKASSNDPLAQCDYGNFSLRFKPVDINFTKPNWDTIMTKRDKPAMSEEEFDEAIKELARKEFATGKRDDDAYRKLCMQHGETVSPDRKAIYESSMKKTGGKMNAACMFWDSKGNKTLSYNPESRNWKDFRGMDDNVAYKNKQIDNVEISNEGRRALREKLREVKPKVEEPIGYELTIQDTNEVEWEHYTSMREYSGLTLKDGKYNLEDVMKSMMDAYETRYNYIVKEHENGERRISYDLTGENSLTLDEDLAGLDRAYNKRLANLAGYIVCQQTNDGSKFFQTTNVKKNTAEQKEYIDTAVSMMEKAQKRFLEMREEPKYTAGIAKSVIGDIMSSDKNFMETTQRLFAKTIYHNAKKNIF